MLRYFTFFTFVCVLLTLFLLFLSAFLPLFVFSHFSSAHFAVCVRSAASHRLPFTLRRPMCALRVGGAENGNRYATILAFDVKVEKEAQELADSLGVKIFQADIIYHLFDKFTAYREELKQKKREEFKNIAVFPCKIKVSL